MQNTRLNTLVDRVLGQFGQWIQNPWRRISLLLISLLLGNFAATAIATTSGQAADYDILIAVLLTGSTEIINWIVYNRRVNGTQRADTNGLRSLFVEMINTFKIGLIYGLFVEAFKLGS